MSSGNVARGTVQPVGVEPYLQQYAALKASLPGAQLPWVAELRDEGRDRFAELGLPTNKVEAWKYTSLRSLARMPFVSGAGASGAGDTRSTAALPGEVTPLLPADRIAARLVFVNGRFSAEASRLSDLPAGIRVGGLAEMLAREPELLRTQLGHVSAPADGPADGHAMRALNTALMADGLIILIGRDVSVEKPIEVLHVTTAQDEAPALHLRNVIVAEAGSSVALIERHIGGDAAYLVNGVTEIRVCDGARLHHYKLQEEGPEAYHLFLTQVRIGRDALYDNFVLSIGSRLARNQIEAVIEGSGAECVLNGAYMGRRRQHLDHTSVIDHASPNARSRQVYHGALGDQSRGVFQGQIIVRQVAQKTDGYQLNRALLLSDGAEIDSKPNLEIYADDVKCSHGATVGDLDADALFYLRARGIPEAEARSLLVAAFLGTVVDQLPVEAARAAFRDRIDAWLGAGLHAGEEKAIR